MYVKKIKNKIESKKKLIKTKNNSRRKKQIFINSSIKKNLFKEE
jgi:hypothetical protein